MATQAFTKFLLTGSTDGRMIPLVATATPGTLIHTATAGTASLDEIWLWANNVTNAPSALTLQWGGVLDPTDHMFKAINIPANSIGFPLALGIPIRNGLVIRGFSTNASSINVYGFWHLIA